MRTVTIPIRGSQIEVFVEKRNTHFEIWTVGVVKERRIVLDHHLTHDDLETRLEYARSEDLIWRDAEPSEIPAEKHKYAIEKEDSIARGVFSDGAPASHFFSIWYISKERKPLFAAKKAILGRWTDGVLSFHLEREHKLTWSCSDSQHWLTLPRNHAPDWWSFGGWQFHLMYQMGTKSCHGIRAKIVHIDERELHFLHGYPNRIATVFRREAQPNTALEPTPTAP